MAKKRLFGNAVEPRCETCALGKKSADGNSVLCPHSGAAPLHHACRRYRYDPLKRIPRKPRPLSAFTEDDFSLNTDLAPDIRVDDDLISQAVAIVDSPDTSQNTAVFIPDDSPDIFRDLERIAAGDLSFIPVTAVVENDDDNRILFGSLPSADVLTVSDDADDTFNENGTDRFLYLSEVDDDSDDTVMGGSGDLLTLDDA